MFVYICAGTRRPNVFRPLFVQSARFSTTARRRFGLLDAITVSFSSKNILPKDIIRRLGPRPFQRTGHHRAVHASPDIRPYISRAVVRRRRETDIEIINKSRRADEAIIFRRFFFLCFAPCTLSRNSVWKPARRRLSRSVSGSFEKSVRRNLTGRARRSRLNARAKHTGRAVAPETAFSFGKQKHRRTSDPYNLRHVVYRPIKSAEGRNDRRKRRRVKKRKNPSSA